MRMEMKRQDMEELYQLLEVYERTYGGRKVRGMVQEVSARYREKKGGASPRRGIPGERDENNDTQKTKSVGSGNCVIAGCRSAE